MKFGVAILGAGASRRMGRPKLLLPWNDSTVIGHLVRQWRVLDSKQIAVVLSDKNIPLKNELDRLGFAGKNRVVNPQPEQGMFSSIRCAANWTGWGESLTHVVITLGDQPHLKRETLRSLIHFAADQNSKICQPALNGRAKHPVVFPRTVFERLGSGEFETLAHFLEANREDIALIEINDPGLGLDLDTPADYEAALGFTSA